MHSILLLKNKTFIFVALALLTPEGSGAFAQGLPPGAQPPVYGSKAFADQHYHIGSVFSELFNQQPDTQLPANDIGRQAKSLQKVGDARSNIRR